MFDQFQTRSTEIEIMDDLSMEGELLTKALDEINLVNRFLGGHQVAISGLKKILLKKKILASSQKTSKDFDSNKPIKIVDLGCGGGDTLKAIETWAKDQNLPLQLFGIDANAFTLQYAQKNTRSDSNIQYLQQNIFSSNCSFKDYDIVICSLFLHHFTEEELLVFFQKCKTSNVKALLINDLQRHWLPYYLFKLLTWALRANPMTKADGGLSIRKGFTRKELQDVFQKSKLQDYTLEWKWAFRYQAICYFNES